MAELFGKDSDTIGLHLKSVFKSGELDEFSTTEFSSVVRQEGKREVIRKIRIYNLDAIISVGYHVNSKRGTQFRIWANKILKDFLIKGFSINEHRLRQQNEQLRELQESVKLTYANHSLPFWGRVGDGASLPTFSVPSSHRLCHL